MAGDDVTRETGTGSGSVGRGTGSEEVPARDFPDPVSSAQLFASMSGMQQLLQQLSLTITNALGINSANHPNAQNDQTTPFPPRALVSALDAAVQETAGGAAGGSAAGAAATETGARRDAAAVAVQLANATLGDTASPPVGGGVPGATDSARDGDSGSRGIKVPISPPELNLDGLKSQQQILRARAFLRDLKRYFAVAEWGSKDEARCVYIAGALKGSAKTWYDDWSLSVGDSFTSEQLLKAIRDRFAPVILSLSEEARNKLSMRRYGMRGDKEAVAAYLTRFNALVTPIHDITTSERIYWFRTGLTEKLASKCARDTDGHPFTCFNRLVQHALNCESKKAAGAFAAASSLRLNFAQAADDAGMETDEEAPAPKRQKRAGGAGPSVAVAEIPDGSLPCPPRTSEETKFGVSKAVLAQRKEAKTCYVCGKSGHGARAHEGYDGWTKVEKKGGQGGRGNGRGGGQGGRGGKGGRGGAVGKAGGKPRK